MKIVFVCTGNTCRSPMAEHVFRSLIGEELADEVEIESAGISAGRGQSAAPPAITVLEEKGINGIRRHGSRPVEDLELQPGDRVYTMTPAHSKRVEATVPDGVKVEVLKEAVGEPGSIGDPFGGDVEVYRGLYDELLPLLEKLRERISSDLGG